MRWTKTDGFFLESLRMVECATADDVLECFREGVKHKVHGCACVGPPHSGSFLSWLYTAPCDPGPCRKEPHLVARGDGMNASATLNRRTNRWLYSDFRDSIGICSK